MSAKKFTSDELEAAAAEWLRRKGCSSWGRSVSIHTPEHRALVAVDVAAIVSGVAAVAAELRKTVR